MGIRYLETFMHRSEGCVKSADIPSLVKKYKKEYGGTPELVIDINSITYFLNKKIAWSGGGQMKEFSELLENLLQRLKAGGLAVTAFVDGVIRPSKVQLWTDKQTQYSKGLVERFEQIRSSGMIMTEDDYFFTRFPANLKDVFIQTLIKCDCKVKQSVINCDIEAAIYAKRNKCFGLLGQDTDFVIFNCTKYYFSMKNLDIQNLSTVTYSGADLAKHLHIDISFLPLWATLVGNGFIENENLIKFHRSLFKPSEKFCRPLVFMYVAKFINHYMKKGVRVYSQLPNLIEKINDLNITYKLVSKSLEYYDQIKFPSKGDDIKEDFKDYGDFNWMELQKVISDLHKRAKIPPIAYNVVFYNHSFYESYFEDPVKKDPMFELVRELRRKIYGILLNEKPRRNNSEIKIKEIFHEFETFDEIVNPIFPKSKELDLAEILTGEDIYKKWDLFFSTCSVPTCFIRIDEKAMIPALALKYIIMKKVPMEIWEIEAVVATFSLLPDYSVDEINKLPEFPVSSDGVLFYWRLIRLFDTFQMLNGVCGSPIKNANPSYYQDGKLFQAKYLLAKGGATLENLCEFKNEELHKAQTIMGELFPK